MSSELSAMDSMKASFEATLPRLPGRDLPWIQSLRDESFARFAAAGLPTQRVESWKYTSLRQLERSDIHLLAQAASHVSIDCAPSLLADSAASHKIVFVDGQFNPALSSLHELPAGVVLDSLGWLLASDPAALEPHLGRIGWADGLPMHDLNSAVMNDGLALIIEPGLVLQEPIELIYLGGTAEAPASYHPRNLMVLGEGAQATVIEHHRGLGDGAYLANLSTEVKLGDRARLRHYKLQHEGPGAFHIATLQGRLGRAASYDGFTLSVGARLSRNESLIRLEGEDAQCHLNGAYLMRGEQHCDTTTEIRHEVPKTSCREVFKGVIDDKARAVFQGRIVVERDAQQSNGHQLSKALLLSDRAEIDQKPELEIYADDVLCSHGATAGDLDHEALFYLRSRGIPEDRARRILIEAFLGEAIGTIAAEGLCPALMSTVGHWLADA